MQFFEHQDQARAKSGRLIFLFSIAVLLLGLVSALAVHFVLSFDRPPDAPAFPYHDQLVTCAALGTWGVILLGSAYKMTTLRAGGRKVAESMGGTLLMANSQNVEERRALNVVEEMAIAAGLPVPPVYLLRGEAGINAFAAGWSSDDAVIGVTQGALQTFTRDQLQGVIAHEFSHILHRDCALNMRLLGVLHGIVVISAIGRFIMHATSGSRHRSTKKEGGATQLFLVGAVIWIFGSLGVLVARLIQAAVSQQREYLADASAVQFTRNPAGIAGALAQIASASSALQSPQAQESSHMLISSPSSSSFAGLLSSHPPLFERIQRVMPSWDGSFDSLITHAPRPDHGDAPASPRTAATDAGLIDLPEHELEAPEWSSEEMRQAAFALNMAHGLLTSLHVQLKHAAHDPYSVRALLVAFILDRDPRARTAQSSTLADDPELLRETYVFEEQLERLSVAERSALFDLCLPTLAALSEPQRAAFADLVATLQARVSDQNFTNYCLALLVLRHLDAPPLDSAPVLVKTAIETALGVLAKNGHATRQQAQAAFDDGCKRLARRGSTLKLPEDEALHVRSLHSSLQSLRRLPVQTRQDLLSVAERVAGHDGVVETREQELLRIMAEALDLACPLARAARSRSAQTEPTHLTR